MRGDIVLVHSSDIHVDDGAGVGNGTLGLRLVVATARAHAADVLILAGDTFEHNRLPIGLLDEARMLLAEAALPVVILPGNHDPATPDSAFHRGRIGELPNVSILGITHAEAVHFPELDLEIWGRAHRDYGDMAPFAERRARRTRWQVAMAHGHYEPAPDRATALRPSWLIGDGDLLALGADYVALGHWNRAIKVGGGGVEAHYSGSPDFAQSVNLVRLKPSGEVAVTRAPLMQGNQGEMP